MRHAILLVSKKRLPANRNVSNVPAAMVRLPSEAFNLRSAVQLPASQAVQLATSTAPLDRLRNNSSVSSVTWKCSNVELLNRRLVKPPTSSGGSEKWKCSNDVRPNKPLAKPLTSNAVPRWQCDASKKLKSEPIANSKKCSSDKLVSSRTKCGSSNNKPKSQPLGSNAKWNANSVKCSVSSNSKNAAAAGEVNNSP